MQSALAELVLTLKALIICITENKECRRKLISNAQAGSRDHLHCLVFFRDARGRCEDIPFKRSFLSHVHPASFILLTDAFLLEMCFTLLFLPLVVLDLFREQFKFSQESVMTFSQSI